MEMYLSGIFYVEKLSMKIFKNAKTASNFCFHFPGGLIFLTYQFIVHF